MSTITRIKGRILNNGLPILTEEGLKTDPLEIYKYRLRKVGYTLSAAREAALETFYNSLKTSGVIDYIDTMYPFIGNWSSVNIPLLGARNLEIEPDFSGAVLNGTDIRGFKNFPKMAEIKLSELVSLKKGLTYSISYIGNLGGITHSDIPPRKSAILFYNPDSEKVSQIQIGHTNTNIKQNPDDVNPTWNYTVPSLLVFPDNSSNYTTSSISFSTDSGSDLRTAYQSVYATGNNNGYELCGMGSAASDYKYIRLYSINDVYYSAYAEPGSGNFSLDMEREGISYHCSAEELVWWNTPTLNEDFTITTLTFFNSVVPVSLGKSYFSALKIFNQAFGKEVGQI